MKKVTGKESNNQVRPLVVKHEVHDMPHSLNSDRGATKTGGRDATLRHIPGDLSLSVGIPDQGTKPGWRWSLLSELATLESGHTPSRRHAEYWGGRIPWIGIQDARDNHGQIIYDTLQHTNELGIKNSSARILPRNTVCLSRTASVGYVVVMGNPMSTSQDFVNWICGPSLLPDFLKYLFLAEGREGLYRFSSGAVHQTIYFPEAKAFCICHPGIDEQKRIVLICDSISIKTKKLEAIYQKKINDLEELKKSILQRAFNGELKAKELV
jgi:type I restriction enzyme S subunit